MCYEDDLFFIWFVFTLCPPVQLMTGVPPSDIYYNTFSDPYGTLKFNHLVVDKDQGWVFIGAVNRLYQLSHDLTLIRNFSTGPMRHYECDIGNCQPKFTHNYNKILVLHYLNENSRLISCGSYTHSSCDIYTFEFNNTVTIHKSDQAVVSSSPNASTVAFIANDPIRGHAWDTLQVGETYTKDSVIPAIATRSLAKDDLLKIGVSRIPWPSGSTGPQVFFRDTYREKYIVNYVYGFNSKKFNYFLTTQMNSTQPSPYISKLIRICQIHLISYRSYNEIIIKCTDTFGKDYNLVQAAFVTTADSVLAKLLDITPQDYVLFGVFARSKQSLGNDSNNPSNESALCMYSLEAIENKFYENNKNCQKGEGYTSLEFITTTKNCNDSHSFGISYCESTRPILDVPVGGNLSAEAIAVITFDIILTAVIAVSKLDFTSVILGTHNGHLKHILVHNTTNTFEFNDVVIHEGYAINSDLQFDPQKKYLYAMTEHKLAKINFHDLLRLPSILSVHPDKGPWEGGTNISIVLKNFDIPLKSIHYDVKIAGIPCTLPKEKFNPSENNIICITNTASNFSKVHEGPVEVFFNGIRVVCGGNFTFVDPEISKFSPTLGPTLGGTELIIKVIHLNAGNSIAVFIGNIQCPVSFWNSSIIKCITLPSNTTMKGNIVVKIDGATRSYDVPFNYIDDSKQIVYIVSNQTIWQSEIIGIPTMNIVYIGFLILGFLIIVSCFVVRKQFSKSSRELVNMQQSMNNFCLETMNLRQCIKQLVIKKNIDLDEELSDVLKLPNITIIYTTVPSTATETLPELDFLLPLDEQWEFARSKLTLGKHLGEGEFGKVLRGEALDIIDESVTTTVAVKMLKDPHSDADIISLASEMEMMKLIGTHENILRLLGCCTQDGELFVITEYALHGNLRDFLRKYLSPANNKITLRNLSEKDLLMFAIQIANGMEYLALIKCIHRDLAARNVLVSEDYTMKIGDFGLAKDIHQTDYYRKKSDGRLPVKWMAPEALWHSIYTSQSDVWSYGILLWEIITLGGTPYASLPDVGKLYQTLCSGYRMEKPPNCSQPIYNLMLKCWSFIPEDRPPFSVIVKDLEEIKSMSNDKTFETCNLYLPDIHESDI